MSIFPLLLLNDADIISFIYITFNFLSSKLIIQSHRYFVRRIKNWRIFTPNSSSKQLLFKTSDYYKVSDPKLKISKILQDIS